MGMDLTEEWDGSDDTKEEQMEGKVNKKAMGWTCTQDILGRTRKSVFLKSGKERRGGYRTAGGVSRGGLKACVLLLGE